MKTNKTNIPQFIFLIIFCIFPMLGCETPLEDKQRNFTESEQYFLDILKDEHNISVVTRNFENSMWIYVPMKESFYSFKSSKSGPITSRNSKK